MPDEKGSTATQQQGQPNIYPYPYQQDARITIEEKWKAGKRALILSMPTGSGKTITFTIIIRDLIEGNDLKALIIAHRDELIEQAYNTIAKKVWPGVDIGIIDADRKEFGDHKIYLASVQTLTKKKNLQQLPPIDYLVTDEGHHSYATSYRRIYDHIAGANPGYHHLGATATPVRTNKKEALSEIYDDIGYSISIFKLIADGFLVAIEGYSIKTALDLSRVRVKRGDYEIKGLSKAVSTGDFNAAVVDGYLLKAGGKKAICYAVDIAHVEQLTAMFKSRKIRAVAVHGQMDKEDRRRAIRGYATGKYRLLVNCMIATEGFDDTATECILVARPTKSITLYTQIVGRGLRLHPGKDKCTLLDFTESGKSTGLMTLKDLIDFYRMPTTARAISGYATEQRPIAINKHTIAGFNMLEELGERAAFDNLDFFDINDFAWSQYDSNRYVALRKNISMAIVNEKGHAGEDLHSVYICGTSKEKPWCAKLNDQPTTYDMALGTCNVFLDGYGDKTFAKTETAWRDKEPSIDQKNYMHSLFRLYKQAVPNTTYHPVQARTSGQASSFINATKTLMTILDDTKRTTRNGIHERLMRIMLSDHISGKAFETPEKHNYNLCIRGIYDDETASRINSAAGILTHADSEFPLSFITNGLVIVEGTTITIQRGTEPRHPLTAKQRAFLASRIAPVLKYLLPSHLLNIAG